MITSSDSSSTDERTSRSSAQESTLAPCSSTTDSALVPCLSRHIQPVSVTSAYQDQQIRNNNNNKLPILPSHRFRFSVWHELPETNIHGPDLHAPRVREGPPIKQEMFHKLRDENGRRIHHSLRGKEARDHRQRLEDWSSVVRCNLSYQDLQHPYQRDNFSRILKQIKRAEDINLMHNSLTDLGHLSFAQCIKLNICHNHVKSFKDMPHMPNIQHLLADDNDISDLKGLEIYAKTPIIYLSLKRNPVSFSINYRQRIFKVLPELKFLDGVPRQTDDGHLSSNDSQGCIIS